MNWKSWAPLAIAIVLGLSAAKLARDVMSSHGHSAGSSNQVAVVVAKEDIAPGAEIKMDDLTTGKLAADKAPENAFTDPAKVAGRVARGGLVKGQAVLDSLLAPQGSGTGLQALVPDGMRAITMDVNESSGVAGLLTPGCHVDVLATLSNGKDDPRTQTVVQDLKIVAIGQRMSHEKSDKPEDKEQFRTVTLIASPKDAEVLELLGTTGRPRLVLRGAKDDQATATTGTRLADVRGESKDDELKNSVFDQTPAPLAQAKVDPKAEPQKQTVAMAPKDSGRIVTVIRGGQAMKVIVADKPDVATAGADTQEQLRGE